MSPNRRIALNIIATYGRSLYGLVIGLFCGRWALMALGHVDFGLMGVVGGLTAFIAFFNGILAGAVGRFYAVTVGKESSGTSGMEQSQKWFTLAVIIHTLLPALLMAIGFPLGDWAVKEYLTIPPERLNSSLWVWRYVCVTCFIGMVTVPYSAMYAAHQFIAELTIYSFVTTTLNAVFLYYMVSHPGDWLARYAFWQCLLSVLPNMIISVRAVFLFKECRFKAKYARQWRDIFKIGSYAFWIGIGSLGAMLRSQGIAILVNRNFGAKANSGVAVGTTLSGQCNTLSASMIGAFTPAICNAWGAGQFDKARMLAYQCCKIGTLLMLVFALPLALEVDEVLILWLKNPPPYASGLCLAVLAMTIIDRMSVGHMICVGANGKVAAYQSLLGSFLIATLPLAWLFVKSGLGVYSVGWAMVITMTACSLGRVWFARGLVKMKAKYWLARIFMPLCALVALSLTAGLMPRIWMTASFPRVCVTTGFVLAVMLPLSWYFILDANERAFVSVRIAKMLRK